MKKVLIILIMFFVPFLTVKAKEMPVDITADSAILVNLDNNTVMYEKNADKEEIMASLTKIMTALVAIENIKNIDDKVTVAYKDLKGLNETIKEIIAILVDLFEVVKCNRKKK